MVQEMETRDTRENSQTQIAPPDVTDTHTPDPKDKPENPNVAILRSAFPEIDVSIIRAVLIASSNNVEKAFDGLLGMSDPTFKPDLPAQTQAHTLSDEQQIQILADEEFARQVALQGSRRSRQQTTGHHAAQQEPTSPENTRNFIDDDLPVLKENIIQGFHETKSKVNSFLSSIRSQYAQKVESQASTGERGSQGLYHQNPRSSTQYDRDAHTLDDDFGELQLEDHTATATTVIRPKAHNSVNSEKPEATSRVTKTDTKARPDSFALGDDDEE